MSDLDRLIEAVEAGSPEWDADFMDGLIERDMNPRPALLVLAAWNGSLDAALRLHQALLPGYALERLTLWHGHPANAHIWGTHEERDGTFWHDHRDGRFEAKADNPARAWLLAILKALKAREGA